MATQNLPGLAAHVDDQGRFPNCTIHAVSKALTEVCDSLGIDVDQDQITKDLKCKHAKGTGMYATKLNKTLLEVKDLGTGSKYFMTASVRIATLQELKAGRGETKYVVDWQINRPLPDSVHCVYAKKWLPIKGKVKCLNSWGINTDPEPLISPDEICEVYAVDLILQQGPDRKLVAASFLLAGEAAADIKKDQLPLEARKVLTQLLNQEPVSEETLVRCHCGDVSSERIGEWPNGVNSGRKFFMCDQRPRACKFFLWKEEGATPYQEANSTIATPSIQAKVPKHNSSSPPMEDRAADVKMTDSNIVPTTEVSNKNPKSDEAPNQLNQQKKGGRKMPNVFVAIQLDNPAIIANMQQVQDFCFEKDASLAQHKLPLEKAHVTLLVAHVEEENLSKAKAAIYGTLQEVISSFPDNKFQLEIKGMGNFGTTVVFAQAGLGRRFLELLNRGLLKRFESMGFESDNRFDSPHSTVLKVTQGHKGIPPELYSKFSEHKFGTQEVSGIKLLSMTKKPTPEGRYHCEGDFLFKDVSATAGPETDEAVRCDCGDVASLLIGKWANSVNNGRKFYMCERRPKACKFFLWEDDRVACSRKGTGSEPGARVIEERSRGAEARPSEASGSDDREAGDSIDELLTLAMKLSEEAYRIETMKVEKSGKKEDNTVAKSVKQEARAGVVCQCGSSSKERTGNWENGRNRGRKFHMCDKQPKGCTFFRWAEDV